MFKPTVGPIIGHTTANHARIFLRGDTQKDAAVFAGIRYRDQVKSVGPKVCLPDFGHNGTCPMSLR